MTEILAEAPAATSSYLPGPGDGAKAYTHNMECVATRRKLECLDEERGAIGSGEEREGSPGCQKLADQTAVHVQVFDGTAKVSAARAGAARHRAFPSPTPRALVYNTAGTTSGRKKYRSAHLPSAGPWRPSRNPTTDYAQAIRSSTADMSSSPMTKIKGSTSRNPHSRPEVDAKLSEAASSRRSPGAAPTSSSRPHSSRPPASMRDNRPQRQQPAASHPLMTPRGTAFSMCSQRTQSLPSCAETDEAIDLSDRDYESSHRRTRSLGVGIGRRTSELDGSNPYGLVLVGSKTYEYNHDRPRHGEQLLKSLKALAGTVESKLKPRRKTAGKITPAAKQPGSQAPAPAEPLAWSDLQNTKPLLTEHSVLASETEWAMNDMCGRNEAFDALATPRNPHEGRIYLAQYTRVMLDLAEQSQKSEKRRG